MRIFARILALVAALLVALPAGAVPRAQYYCRIMGQVIDSCCCKARQRATAEPKPTEIRHPSCCELVTSSDDAAPATRDGMVHVPAAGLVATLPAVHVDMRRARGSLHIAPLRARGPPALASPLYLKTCKLLI